MEIYEVLEKAVERLEKGWVFGKFATTSQGKACDPTSSEATNWCARGAILSVLGINAPNHSFNPAETLYVEAVVKAGALEGSGHITSRLGRFSNNKGQRAVVALFKKAIRLEKAKAGVPIAIPETVKEPAY